MLYEALDVVSRELVGMIPAVTLDPRSDMIAKGQTVRIPIAPDASNEDVTAGASAPTGNGDTFGDTNITITKVRRGTPIVWTGEEELSIGSLVNPLVRDQYSQRMRSLVNEMEQDICIEASGGAITNGNVQGSAGTEPFATNLNSLTAGLKMLKDNGAPQNGDYQFVMNTTAGKNLRNLTQLQKVNEGGDNTLLRQGLLGNLFGFNLRESNGFQTHTTGDGTGYLVNGKALKGANEITMDTGSGTFKKGDIVTFGSDTTKYVVAEDVATGGTTLKIASVLGADVADNTAITIGSGYLPSVGFTRGSILLATRLPKVPANGDIALDRTVITDPVSGISFEVALWGGAYQNTVTIASAWGVRNIKPAHSFALIG